MPGLKHSSAIRAYSWFWCIGTTLLFFSVIVIVGGCEADLSSESQNVSRPGRSDSDFDLSDFENKLLQERVRSLRAQSNEQLLRSIAAKKTINKETIAEMIRRGGPEFLRALQQRYEACQQERFPTAKSDPEVRWTENDKLRILSAVHRMKGLPDPLPVVIKGDARRELTFPAMPIVEVAIVNKHPEQRKVTWQDGGNYRHGRRESFGFDVRRDNSELMPVLGLKTIVGGGLISLIELKPGEEWTNTMPLSAYVKLLPPGKYHVRAAYVFGHDIGMLPDKSATFMCFSPAIELVVHRRTVRLTPSERSLAERWCHALPAEQPVKIVEGGYNKEADAQFISPQSLPGKILQLGWKAVPSLIGALEDKQLKRVQRAWAFALLYSITGDNDPRGDDLIERLFGRDGPLGAYEIRTAGWDVEVGKGGGCLSPPERQSFLTGKINAEKQAKLATQWIAWKKNINVIENREPGEYSKESNSHGCKPPTRLH